MAEPGHPEWRKDYVPTELVELRNYLDQLPHYLRQKLVPLCDRVGHFSRLQGKLVRIAQDAVDQLQLDVKYLLFDLDATRREREELKLRLREVEGIVDEEDGDDERGEEPSR